MHNAAFVHLVDDLADGGNGDLGKFLVAADGINGAHDVGEGLLAHNLHNAVDPAVALEAVHQLSQLVYFGKFFEGFDAGPKLLCMPRNREVFGSPGGQFINLLRQHMLHLLSFTKHGVGQALFKPLLAFVLVRSESESLGLVHPVDGVLQFEVAFEIDFHVAVCTSSQN